MTDLEIDAVRTEHYATKAAYKREFATNQANIQNLVSRVLASHANLQGYVAAEVPGFYASDIEINVAQINASLDELQALIDATRATINPA